LLGLGLELGRESRVEARRRSNCLDVGIVTDAGSTAVQLRVRMCTR
jgi:hypothetical protein